MGIPNKQIGWSQESNLLWQISKQMETLTSVTYNSGGGGGGLTSVGLSMPEAFTVTNSPLTSNGTLNVVANGLGSQYVRGDGTLGDFPDIGGGGGQVLYFNGGTSQGVIGGNTYYELGETAATGPSADFSVTGDGFLARFITDVNSPSRILIPSGTWNFRMYFSTSTVGGTPTITATIQKYDGATFTTIGTSIGEVITGGATEDLYNFAASFSDTVIASTDRIAITLTFSSSDGGTATLYTEGSNISEVETTFPTGISSINGLTATSQSFATGTTGTDFNIVSSGDTHTFNLPTASSTARGVITSAMYNAITYNVITATANYLALQTDSVILANAAGGAITITLPSAIGANKPVTIKRINAGANAVNINTVLSQTFDGSTTGSINVQNQSLTFVSNGANWFII
jgi:hypothetical protein